VVLGFFHPKVLCALSATKKSMNESLSGKQRGYRLQASVSYSGGKLLEIALTKEVVFPDLQPFAVAIWVIYLKYK